MKYTLPLLFFALVFGCKNSGPSPSTSSNTAPSEIVLADSAPKIPAPAATTLAVAEEKPVFPVYQPLVKSGLSEPVTVNESSAAILSYNTQNTFATLFEQPEEKAQTFVFNPVAAQNFLCSEGSRLFIPANAFVLEATGKQVIGEVTLHVSEYYELGDILLSKLSTRTADQLLETGGMLFLAASADGQPCILAPGKQIEIDFSGTEIWDKMSTFYGVKDSSDNIIWEAAQETAQNRIIHFTDDPKAPWYYGDADNISYTHCDKMPEFPGGNFALKDFVNSKMVYPDSALAAGAEGKLFISFVISDSGFVRNIEIDSSIGFGCDNMVKKIFSQMPLWTPGFENSVAVDVKMTLPVVFTFGTDDFFIGIKGVDPDAKTKKQFLKSDIAGAWFNGAFYRDNKKNSRYDYSTASTRLPAVVDTFSSRAYASYITNSMITVSKLGWINCDRYIGNPDFVPVNYVVDLDVNKDAEFTMIFSSANSVLKGVRKNRSFIFYNVPKGVPVTLLGIKVEAGEFYYCMKELNIDNIKDKDYNFILTTRLELIDLANSFNKETPVVMR